jgi:hypothetical protein
MRQTHRVTSGFVFTAALLAAACETAPVAGPNADPEAPRFAVVANPRATFTYFDQGSEQRFIAGVASNSGYITGDGRDSGGNPLTGSSVYHDGLCGVEAQVFIGASGDATMDPIGKRMAGCNSSVKRAVTLSYGDPIVGAGSPLITAAHFTNVRQVETLPYNGPAGNVAFRRFRLQPRGTTKCDWVRYGTTAANGQHVDFVTTIGGMTVTSKPMRLEAIAPNTWIASSQADENGRHVAICEESVGKGVSYTAAYDIPFRIQVVMRQ